MKDAGMLRWISFSKTYDLKAQVFDLICLDHNKT